MCKKLITALLLSLVTCTFSYATIFDNEISIHCFGSTGYMKSTDNNFLMNTTEGSFKFNEFGINFGTD